MERLFWSQSSLWQFSLLCHAQPLPVRSSLCDASVMDASLTLRASSQKARWGLHAAAHDHHEGNNVNSSCSGGPDAILDADGSSAGVAKKNGMWKEQQTKVRRALLQLQRRRRITITRGH